MTSPHGQPVLLQPTFACQALVVRKLATGWKEQRCNLTCRDPRLYRGARFHHQQEIRCEIQNPVQLLIRRTKRSRLDTLAAWREKTRLSEDRYYLLRLLCSFIHNIKVRQLEKQEKCDPQQRKKNKRRTIDNKMAGIDRQDLKTTMRKMLKNLEESVQNG